jgi:hypothetical protein
LLFNFSLEYVIRKVQEKQVELKLNGTYQLLIYANDVNLWADNINVIEKSAEALIRCYWLVKKETQRRLSICCCLVTRMQGKIMTLSRIRRGGGVE